MTNAEIVAKLKAQNYDIVVENGVVIMRTNDPTMNMDKFGKILADMGYQNSFGMQLTGDAALFHGDPVGGKKKAAKKTVLVIEKAETVEETSEESPADTSGFDFSMDETGQMSLF